jgi:hypothetical protein
MADRFVHSSFQPFLEALHGHEVPELGRKI